MPKVVITMPAYRAERTLAQTVADIPPDIADQLILVDDASPDNTARLARELGIDVYVHSTNLGYGGNQKTCYTEALRNGADIVVLLHPDYQYEPKAVPLLIAPILAGDADMTFGSRFAGLGDPIGGGMPIYRYIGNRVTTILENLMLGSRFSELHTGLRAYTRRCLLSLPFLRYSDDFVFDSQLLIDAITSGHRVVEVPIPTRYTKESSSISISRSSTYIVKSLGYCASRAAVRGRRGRRSPVVRARSPVGPARGVGPRIGKECIVCGGEARIVPSGSRLAGAGARPAAGLARCNDCGFVFPPAAELKRCESRSEGSALDPAMAKAVARRMLDAIGGYVMRGNRLLVPDAHRHLLLELASKQGWLAIPAESERGARTPDRPPAREAQRMPGEGHARYAAVDAVVLIDGLQLAPDPVEALRRLDSMLDPEGILAVAAPISGARRAWSPSRARLCPERRYAFSPESLHTALHRAGFRMVEWFPPQSLTGDRTLLARLASARALPVSHFAGPPRDPPKEPAPYELTSLGFVVARPAASAISPDRMTRAPRGGSNTARAQ